MHSDSNGPDARTSVKGASMPADAWVAPKPGSRASKTDTAAPREASSQAPADPTRPAPTTMTAGFGTGGSVARRRRRKPGRRSPDTDSPGDSRGLLGILWSAERCAGGDAGRGTPLAIRRSARQVCRRAEDRHVSTQPPTPSPVRPPRPGARTPLTFLVLAGTCVVAAGVGGYVAQSHRTTDMPTVEARPAQAAPVAAAPKPSTVPASPAVVPAAPIERVGIESTPTEMPSPRSPRTAAPASEPAEAPTKDRRTPAPAPTPTQQVGSAARAQQPNAPAPPART